jgi:mannose/cellobiose epimerase-like protein (N-acyl-D-glucosamine 2-epimerase family)
MKTLAAILTALALSAASASAQVQVTPSTPQNTAFGADPIIRITAAFRTAVEATDPREVPDAKAQEAARRALYDMAANECAVLSEIFKAECRLSSLTIVVSLAPQALAANVIPLNPAMNASVVYELKPTGAGSTR